MARQALSLQRDEASREVKVGGPTAVIGFFLVECTGSSDTITSSPRVQQWSSRVLRRSGFPGSGARRELEATLTEKDRHIRQMDEKATNATNTQKELEAVLREKDSRIRQMEEKAIGSNPDQMAALMEILQRKEVELEEIKTRFQDFKKNRQSGCA